MHFESAAPRYDLQQLSNDDVQVRMPYPRRLGILVISAAFLVIWVGVGAFMAFGTGAPAGFSIGAICITLIGLLFVGGNLIDMIAGFELIVVNNTAWSYTRSYGCLKTTKHYNIELMGPLKTTTVTFFRREHDNDRRYSRTKKCFGFDYGGRTISMGFCFLDEEIEPFINHLKDYLPNHIKPQA
ncbi:hypothetical protein Ae201684P_009569 [Aphanomyces euteiches]|uniref:Uncharacterized protein n=1 Tax=Aphanomyces euteiches TaxID=100861 RepID=A0A6G0WKW8_9STRA|nr:hypothetical protein Ae201684_014158 [Aphanomyces euteiches]KAH9096339.1 hypothetical protein Ae201684P_009569 [Aphanomyces euteiches]